MTTPPVEDISSPLPPVPYGSRLGDSVMREVRDSLAQFYYEQEQRRHALMKYGQNSVEFKGFSSSKATKVYNQKVKGVYWERYRNLVANAAAPLFITLTVDPPKDGTDTLAMWKKAKRELLRTLAAYRRNAVIEYFSVWEADECCMPHVHLVLDVKEVNVDTAVGVRYTSTDPFNFTDQILAFNWELGGRHVEYVKDDERAHCADFDRSDYSPLYEYVTKNLSVSTDGVAQALRKDPSRQFEDYEYKAMAATYYTHAAQAKQFAFSRGVSGVSGTKATIKKENVVSRCMQVLADDTMPDNHLEKYRAYTIAFLQVYKCPGYVDTVVCAKTYFESICANNLRNFTVQMAEKMLGSARDLAKKYGCEFTRAFADALSVVFNAEYGLPCSVNYVRG